MIDELNELRVVVGALTLELADLRQQTVDLLVKSPGNGDVELILNLSVEVGARHLVEECPLVLL